MPGAKTLTITLPEDIEAPHLKRASEEGTTPDTTAARLLRSALRSEAFAGSPEAGAGARDSVIARVLGGYYARMAADTGSLESDRFASEKAQERQIEERRSPR